MAGPVRISILANATQAQNTFNQTASGAQRMGSRVSGAFRSMAGPATAVVGALALVGKASVQAASDAQQSIGGTESIFGKFAQNVIKTSDQAATAYGLSANEYRENANLIGALLKNQGVEMSALGGETEKLVARGADLASMFGGTTADAVGALSAAFKGEFDSLDKYGINLNATKIQAELAAKGQDKLTGAALDAAKQQATMSLVMGQSSDAAGNFARESDTLAGKQAVATAQVENLKAKLGTALLPVLAKVTGALTKVVEFLTKHSTIAQVLAGVLGVLAVAVLAVNAAMLLNPAVLVVAGIAALIAVLVVAYQRSETFRSAVQSVAAAFTTNVLPALRSFAAFITGQVIPKVIQIAQAIGAKLKPIITQLAQTFQSQVVPALQKAAAKFREMWPTIQRIITVVISLYGKFLTFVATVAGKVIPVVIRVAGFFLSKMIPAITNTISVGVQIISKMIEIGTAIVNAGKKAAEFVKSITSKFGEAIRFIAGIPGKVTGALGDLGGLLLNAGRDLIQGFINGIGEMFGAVQDKLGDLTGKLTSWKGPPKKDKVLLRPAGRMIIEGLIKGFNDGRQGVKDTLGDITDLIAKTLKERGKTPKQAAAITKKIMRNLKDEAKALEKNAIKREKVYKRLDAAEKNLADKRKQRSDYAASVKGAAISFAAITGLDTAFNAEAMLAKLRQRLEKIRQFNEVMRSLIAQGLNRTAIDQLAQAGVEGGLASAIAIQQGGAAAITEFNALQTQIDAAAGSLGNATSSAMFDAGVQSAAGLVKGLKSKAKELERFAIQLGRDIAKALRNALGIKSPSRVFKDIGKQTLAGLQLGIEDASGVRKGMANLGSLMERSYSAPDLMAAVDAASGKTAASTTNNYTINVTAPVGSSPADIGREITKYVTAYEKAGGRRAA